MRSLLVLALALGLVGTVSAAEDVPLGAPSSWIDHMTAALWPSEAMSAKATLVTHDPSGSGLDIDMVFVRYQDHDAVRTQIRVLSPQAAKGTVYEIRSRDHEPLERIAYLPEIDRTRSVFGVHRTDGFLGSEFSYEDLDIAAPVESKWRSVERLEEGARSLVRITSEPYSYYSRVERVVDPKTYLPVRVLYYDTEGKLLKRASFDEVESVDGHPIPTRIVMEDVQDGDKSELLLHDIHLHEAVDEKLFSESPIGKRRVGHQDATGK